MPAPLKPAVDEQIRRAGPCSPLSLTLNSAPHLPSASLTAGGQPFGRERHGPVALCSPSPLARDASGASFPCACGGRNPRGTGTRTIQGGGNGVFPTRRATPPVYGGAKGGSANWRICWDREAALISAPGRGRIDCGCGCCDCERPANLQGLLPCRAP
jgi:hypothetical protein